MFFKDDNTATPNVYWATLLGIAALMTIKYFPGLENEVAYAGNAFQTIFPDSFFGDPSLDPAAPITAKPLRLSLYYVFPKLTGAIWLNDFFLAFFYCAMVAIGLLGVDRIARTLGLENAFDRLIVLLFFAKDHQLLTGKVLLAHHQDVNPSALAIPVIIWLMYFALARKPLLALIAVSALLVGVSARAALFPVALAMGAKFATGSRNERITIALLVLVGFALMYAFLFHVYPVAGAERLKMWDVLLAIEGDDANAFYPDSLGPLWLRHGIWLIIIGMAFLLRGPDHKAATGLKTMMAIGAAIWLTHGLYLNMAPDFLKAPLLISTVPARSLSVVQNIAYIAILVACLSGLRARPTPRILAQTLAVLVLLYAVGPGNRLMWAGLVLASLIFVGAALWWWSSDTKPLRLWVERVWQPMILLSFLLATGIGYTHAAYKNHDAWVSAWTDGVFGNSSSAKWVGVDNYIRTETDPKSSVLAYTCIDEKGRCTRIVAQRSLATRSGRAMSVPDVVGVGFTSVATWEKLAATREALITIGAELVAGNGAVLGERLHQLTPVPSHIVLPRGLPVIDEIEQNAPLKRLHDFKDYVVFKRTDGNQAMPAQSQ